MTGRHVEALGKDALRTFLDWADAADRHLECVFIGRFALPERTSCEAYVKLYPDEGGRNKGLINEISAYVLGRQLGLPVAARAFVALIPLKHLGKGAPRWLATTRRARPFYPGFCTTRIAGRGAALQFAGIDSTLLRQDILKWKQLPGALAFDDHVANTDRHCNNLLYRGSGDYALIDHGRLANDGGPHWTRASLDAARLYRCRLVELLWQGATPPLETGSGALHAGAGHEAAFAAVRDELHYWWSLLLPRDEQAAFQDFFVQRTARLDTLLKTRYRLIA